MISPPDDHSWWKSHAQSPTVLVLNDRLWRVYFGARDDRPVSRIMCADLDPSDNMRVLELYPEPVLEQGGDGCFDAHGLGPGSVIVRHGKVYLYYSGIVRRVDVPYALSIGLATSSDGLKFKRETVGPVMGIGPRDPYLTGAPCVRQQDDCLELWYISGLGWSHKAGEPREEPLYNIRRTYSADGVLWDVASEHVVGEDGKPDNVVARPWLLQLAEQTYIWYARRGSHGFRGAGPAAYRIWEGLVNPEISGVVGAAEICFANPPEQGEWDGEMQAYACVVPHGDDLVMLYNGNGFGRTGFGYARLPGGALPSSR